MSLYVLDVVCWIFGIRGHIPHDGDFPARPNKPPLGPNASRMMRVLAAAVAIAILSLLLWAAVGLAIKSL